VNDALVAFVRRMPKMELHLHLEGTVRPETLLELARRHDIDLPATDARGIAQWYRFRDFRHFLDVWLTVLSCLREPEDFARITRELGEAAAAQHVRHVEAIFTPATHERYKGLSHDGVWAGIRDGAAWVRRQLGVSMTFIVDVPRNRRPNDDGGVEATAAWAIAHQAEGIVALGLGGSEVDNPPELFADVFRAAKAQGLHVYPHAGETVGPESVWGAVRALGAERIAHGVRAVADETLLHHLAAHGIACDVCPTSNVRLGLCPSIEQHPIRRLIDAGVPVTIGSDDPALFQTTITDEYLSLARAQSFTATELARLVRTAVAASFLPKAEKHTLAHRVEAELARAAGEAGVTL
jgi:adenosine deaminase